ncbi:MAG: (2Fe-2S)-binding protein [Armatimonadota bacterium]|nr:(2Fe-2S)-binding protein [Armatimonadota bacterium]MDR7475987.1 (2Fe-2S)-binding protein [Armatimonadota bacterium]MDR7540263.1 (2Fe-2S)-binding protein [Armatimonadota bacterium]
MWPTAPENWYAPASLAQPEALAIVPGEAGTFARRTVTLGSRTMSPQLGLDRTMPVALRVNGTPYVVHTPVNHTLLDLLRDGLGLTGTKESCREGVCGACTVLLDGRPVTACLVLAASADGRSVVTIEGIAGDGGLHPVQEALVECGGVQCGYCTPGVVLSAVALLAEVPDPTEEQIRRALSGNLCRCTGYAKIVQAVQVAARRLATRAARVHP